MINLSNDELEDIGHEIGICVLNIVRIIKSKFC